MSWSLNKKHTLLILSILIISVELQATRWSQLYQTCVSNNVRHVIAMIKKHPIISFAFLFIIIISKRLNQDIHEAVNKGDSMAVRYKLWRGFDIHAKNEFGHNLIHHAAMSDQPNIIKILFNHDSSVIKSLDSSRKTALVLAVEHGKAEAVKFLFCKVNPDKDNLFQLLYSAVSNGHKEVVGHLIDKGAKEDLLSRLFVEARKTDREKGGMGMEKFLIQKLNKKPQAQVLATDVE